MKLIIIEIPGRPRPQYRHRHSKWGGGYDHPKNVENKAYLKSLFMKELGNSPLPFFGKAPIELQVYAHFKRPKAMRKDKEKWLAHTKRPDMTNIIKLIEDMGNKFLWYDDAQIHSLKASKAYAPYDSEYAPKTVILLKETEHAFEASPHSKIRK